ncbi:MAG: PqqD family protein [Clostridia bacterium]|nr:PqqD family protein [Clostridia bacterium]
MKIKDNYILREIAGSYMVIPCGEELQNFSGMITLNETGAFLWKLLTTQQTQESLVAALLEEYDVEQSLAEQDVAAFLNAMREGGLLVDA